eukprot:CAMPEP_0114145316 /NCGR_PEP_ID=MMETSP0043_2-20121206/19984_1 /TAXON_ID=464988 /ORGANISM="Hemiselmis andersenii, Strain CCMP644" /LENGTH=107 /DNA_ID=CAMNT_0001239731 /DNA_START=81 /DNA_END=401 /DNA_ORIENTATION=-
MEMTFVTLALSLGSTAQHRSIASTYPVGAPALAASGTGGVLPSFPMIEASCSRVLPAHGTSPVSTSHSTTPSDQMSACRVGSPPPCTSGACHGPLALLTPLTGKSPV